jgi:hypothetical protein
VICRQGTKNGEGRHTGVGKVKVVTARRGCCRDREKEGVEVMGVGLGSWEGAGQQ